MEKSSNNPKISTATMWSNKPVKMKLFGAWEIDKTPSDCIPRLCSLNITRLTINRKSFGSDVSAIMVAVKMQNSKRILRSNEISIPSHTDQTPVTSATIDIELDLSFTLQYPHFIKRNRNYLQIILQRRKKYKNKAILGYKTLACGLIDMVEVLQRSTISEKQLDLIGRVKDSGKNEPIARITISSLRSQPIDQESSDLRRGKVSIDRPDVYSDDEDFTSAEDGSDSETVEEGAANVRFAPRRKLNERKSRSKLFSNQEKFRSGVPTNVQQLNLKQKFISLIKKFRLPDSEAYDSEEKFQEALEKELMSSTQEPPDIDEFFDDEEIDDLDYLTDSGQEFDEVSISSTPKPSLRPFFSSCTLVGQDKSYEFPVLEAKKEDSQDNSGTEGTPETSDTSQKQTILEETKKKAHSFDKEAKKTRFFPKEKSTDWSKSQKDKNRPLQATVSLLSSASHPTKDDNTSKEFVLDQLNKVFPAEENSIPEGIIFVNLAECSVHTQTFLQLFERNYPRVVGTNTLNEVKFAFNFLCQRIQKFCNNNLRIVTPIKIGLVGSDAYVNSFLRFYVDSLAIKSPEWQTYLRFYIVPPFNHSNNHSSIVLHKYLASIDVYYSNSFLNTLVPANHNQSKDIFESSRSTTDAPSLDSNNNVYMHELFQKVVNFMNSAQTTVIQMPIAEAMVTFKDKNFDDESNQVFIPFIGEVKIGLADTNNHGNNHHTGEEETVFPSGVNASSTPLSQAASGPSSSAAAGVGGDKGITSPTSNKEQHHSCTPPNSPIISSANHSMLAATSANKEFCYLNNEIFDLQVDYWTLQPRVSQEGGGQAKKGDNCKFTLKNSFRSIQISRLPNFGEFYAGSLTLLYVTKEKKQKIMRLGKKKEKDVENRCQVIEGVCRLICSYKSSQAPIKVIIDGVEYSGVKFFQLTSQWQTQIKFFPIVLFSAATDHPTNLPLSSASLVSSVPTSISVAVSSAVGSIGASAKTQK